eukprot:gene26434-33011_t
MHITARAAANGVSVDENHDPQLVQRQGTVELRITHH